LASDGGIDSPGRALLKYGASVALHGGLLVGLFLSVSRWFADGVWMFALVAMWGVISTVRKLREGSNTEDFRRFNHEFLTERGHATLSESLGADVSSVARQAGEIVVVLDGTLSEYAASAKLSESEVREIRPLIVGAVSAFGLAKLSLLPSLLGDPKRRDVSDRMTHFFQEMAEAARGTPGLEEMVLNDGVGISLLELAEQPPPEFASMTLPAFVSQTLGDHLDAMDPASTSDDSGKRQLLASMVAFAYGQLQRS
jgi:hypothetical protein